MPRTAMLVSWRKVVMAAVHADALAAEDLFAQDHQGCPMDLAVIMAYAGHHDTKDPLRDGRVVWQIVQDFS